MERYEDVLRETRNRIRVGKAVGQSFWTGRRVRQGCPMSPYVQSPVRGFGGGYKERRLRRNETRWGENIYSGVCR